MGNINWFRIKATIFMVVFIVLMNSLLISVLSQGFFSADERLFLLLVINQIYILIGGVIIYQVYDYKKNKIDKDELKYLINTIKKWQKIKK